MAWLHAVIDVPASSHAAASVFWSEGLGWPAGESWPGHPELRSFEPPDGAAYVHLQEIDGAPRVHLDVESPDPEASVSRAVELGAALAGRQDEWQPMRSPGGLPFCVFAERDRQAPEPVRWPDGHRSRMVQVCIDAPSARIDAEVTFWRALLGGRWVESSAPEFAGKWHDDAGSPLQLLFQRLDEVEGPVRAHLDHGTDDLEAEVRRVLGLGAVDVGRGHGGWHVLQDPVGQAFCVTENPPNQVLHRPIG
jgi:hypothetical protein